MALNKNMSVKQIKDFLQHELLMQLENDVKPIISVKLESGFFGIPKQLMTFVDFLGALHRGITVEKDKNGNNIKILNKTSKAKLYIQKVLGEIDELYEQNGHTMYEMYRHGLIHLYQPKDLRKGKRRLSWISYKGPRNSAAITIKTDGGDFPHTVSHLKIAPHPLAKDLDLLPISVNCLYEDVYSSVEVFLKKIEKYKKYQTRWRGAVNFLLRPKKYNYH